MNLKDATTLATKFTDSKRSEQGLHVVHFLDQKIHASDGSHGVIIEVDELNTSYWVGKSIAVDAVAFKKIVVSLKEPTLKVHRNSLIIEDAGMTFKLRGLPKRAIPEPVAVPDLSVAPKLSEAAGTALATLTTVGASTTASTGFGMAGVRLTPWWSASGSGVTLAVAWCAVLPTDAEPVTIPGTILEGLRGKEFALLVARGRVWVKHDDEVRWALPFAAEWPDASVNDILTKCRAEKDAGERTVAMLSGDNLASVAKKAAMVAERNTCFKLDIGTQLELSAVAFDQCGFHGTVELGTDTTIVTAVPVGVAPAALSQIASAVNDSCDDKLVAISVGTPSSPIVMWGGGPYPFEAVVMPAFLPS